MQLHFFCIINFITFEKSFLQDDLKQLEIQYVLKTVKVNQWQQPHGLYEASVGFFEMEVEWIFILFLQYLKLKAPLKT